MPSFSPNARRQLLSSAKLDVELMFMLVLVSNINKRWSGDALAGGRSVVVEGIVNIYFRPKWLSFRSACVVYSFHCSLYLVAPGAQETTADLTED